MAFKFEILSAADEQNLQAEIDATKINANGGVSPFTENSVIEFTGETQIAKTANASGEARYNLLLKCKINDARTEVMWASTFCNTKLEETLGVVGVAELVPNCLNSLLADKGFASMTIKDAKVALFGENGLLKGKKFVCKKLQTKDNQPLKEDKSNKLKFYSYKSQVFLPGNFTYLVEKTA